MAVSRTGFAAIVTWRAARSIVRDPKTRRESVAPMLAPSHSEDPRGQLPHEERFHHVVVGTDPERVEPIALTARVAQDDDVRGRASLAQHPEEIHA